MDLTLSGNVNYLPPGGSSNVNTPLAVAGTYGAQALATIDVPSGSASGTAFAIGFGSVARPIGLVVKNTMPSGGLISLALNASGAKVDLAPGGISAIVQPNGPATSNPLSAAWVTVVGQNIAGTIEIMVFGD